jgi:hypothetical protein
MGCTGHTTVDRRRSNFAEQDFKLSALPSEQVTVVIRISAGIRFYVIGASIGTGKCAILDLLSSVLFLVVFCMALPDP